MRGKHCSLSDAFMILLTGNASSSAYSLSSQLGISSGPFALVGFNLIALLECETLTPLVVLGVPHMATGPEGVADDTPLVALKELH